MEVLDLFPIFDSFPQKLDIKCFHVSTCTSLREENIYAYCVTNEEKVYVLGDNLLMNGYSHNERQIYLLINELSHKNIEQFFYGWYTMFALSNTNEVYYWSKIDFTKSGEKCVVNDEFSKPAKLGYFDDKNIVQIDCGFNQCLALSSDGMIYGYGYKLTDLSQTNLEFTPLTFIKDIIHDDMIRFIKFYFDDLYLATFNGKIHLFEKGDLLKDKSIQLNSIEEIISHYGQDNYEIFDLCLDIPLPFNWLISCKSETESEPTFYEIFKIRPPKVRKIECRNMFEYFLGTNKLTYKTILIKNKKLFVHKLKKGTDNKVLINELEEIKPDLKKLIEKQFVNNLPKILEKNVKFYIESKDLLTSHIEPINNIFCTNNSEVYVSNSRFKLKVEEKVNAPEDYEGFTKIQFFSGKNIKQFFKGVFDLFAINNRDEIFHMNLRDINSCKKLDFFDDKNIIEISCGNEHYLALSSDGLVYGWGTNKENQLGDIFESVNKFFRPNVKEYISTDIEKPIVLNELYFGNSKIKFIDCSFYNSSIITTDGKAYVFGKHCRTSPQLIEIEDVKKMCIGLPGYCSVLTYQRQIFSYKFENGLNISGKIDISENVSDVYNLNEFKFLAQCENCVCLIDFITKNVKKCNYLNNYDYMLNKYNGIHNETVHIGNDGSLFIKSQKFNDKYKNNPIEPIFIFEDKILFDNKYENQFDVNHAEYIDGGAFGEVFKVKSLKSNQYFAIKRIEIRENRRIEIENQKKIEENEEEITKQLNEIRLLFKMKSDFVVQYFDSWIEGKAVFGPKITKYLFIQMELGSQNLSEFIKDFKELKDNCVDQLMPIMFHISCHILRDITECVNYLHEFSRDNKREPIIHRDLKPGNIIITDGSDGKFLKLCDFGFAKIHNQSNHSRMKGTEEYRAPEVKYGKHYNLKSDIYSLALIATEIFHFKDDVRTIRDNRDNGSKGLKEYLVQYKGYSFDDELHKFENLLEQCLKEGKGKRQEEDGSFVEFELYNLRPSCGDIILKIDELLMKKIDLRLNNEFLSKVYRFKTCPFRSYCLTKFQYKYPDILLAKLPGLCLNSCIKRFYNYRRLLFPK